MRQGSLPRLPACFANLALPILRLLGATNLSKALRSLRANQAEACSAIIA